MTNTTYTADVPLGLLVIRGPGTETPPRNRCVTRYVPTLPEHTDGRVETDLALLVLSEAANERISGGARPELWELRRGYSVYGHTLFSRRYAPAFTERFIPTGGVFQMERAEVLAWLMEQVDADLLSENTLPESWRVPLIGWLHHATRK